MNVWATHFFCALSSAIVPDTDLVATAVALTTRLCLADARHAWNGFWRRACALPALSCCIAFTVLCTTPCVS